MLKYALEHGGRVVLFRPNGFAPREKAAGGELFDLMAEGRLVVLAPALYRYGNLHLTRQLCQRLNALAAEMAATRPRILY